MRFFRWIRSWMTMKPQYHYFTDAIDGKQVWVYIDCYGARYMANRPRWGFRVEMQSRSA